MTTPQQSAKPGLHEMILELGNEADRLACSARVAGKSTVYPEALSIMTRRAEVFTAAAALLLKVDDHKEAIKDVLAGKKPTQRRAG